MVLTEDNAGRLTLDRSDGVLTVSLNRPAKYNAIDSTTVHELRRVFVSVGDDASIGAVVITGFGKAFAAGADLGEYAVADAQAFAALTENANELCREIRESPVPVIAAVNGVALGGGFEVVLSCDLVVAAESARFGLPEIKLGLIPGWGGTQRLAQYVGPNRAKQLIFTGETITAHEAAAAGIVNRMTTAEELLEVAGTLAASCASGPRLAIAAAKRAVDGGAFGSPTASTGFALEQSELRGLFASSDGQEGIAAFLAKRPADFTGR
ncbi:enoyl-CoA hydratase/isomerase family protein (plasmid) [Glaciihabitans sp. INWT7]|uniref:enoyl-CoA hydratase/isomerase family protein n=1 Tax=Glaciihabitans sp. INWT7 TaxID=2596912 RepID=UPI00162A3EB0|nr:enoyl-CoA hydratase/isomerase family protein [Glaciihabitans sp. INWT7]QNE48632.1 enoyl-CoA hydratase/isomerase family protein [Glaciihabitans sp. INWT7]